MKEEFKTTETAETPFIEDGKSFKNPDLYEGRVSFGYKELG